MTDWSENKQINKSVKIVTMQSNVWNKLARTPKNFPAFNNETLSGS